MSYKYRIEDTRLGRFFSVDPLSDKYPYNSTYAFSENRVFDGVELEGLEFSGKSIGAEASSYEGARYETTVTLPTMTANGVVNAKNAITYIYHKGTATTKAGWYEEGAYLSNVIYPMAKELWLYNKGEITSRPLWDKFSKNNIYTSPFDPFGQPSPLYNLITSVNIRKYIEYSDGIEAFAGYLKDNPHYDGWDRHIPVWGALCQAKLDREAGNYGRMALGYVSAIGDGLLLGEASLVLKSAVNKGVGYIGYGYFRFGSSLGMDLNLHPRLTTIGLADIRGMGYGQFDIGHRSTAFLRSEIFSNGQLGVKNWNTFYYNYTLGQKQFSVGINPWTRTLFHEGPGLFK